MSAPVEAGAAGFLARYRSQRATLPGAEFGWMAAAREDAASLFAHQGLPTQRVEAWKYTSLLPVSKASFARPVIGPCALPAPRAEARAVFVDGHFRPDLSTLGSHGDALVLSSLGQDAARAEGWFGSVAEASHALVSLNTILAEDGLMLEVPAGKDAGTLEILSLSSGTAGIASVHPRHLVRLGAGARLVLLETGAAAGAQGLANPVLEIMLAEDAHLQHLRLQQESRQAYHLAGIFVRVAARARYQGFLANFGAALARQEVHAALLGPGADVHVNGAQLGRDGQVLDVTTQLDHAAPECTSRQVVKTVLSGRSRGVFQGRILVRQVAQRTDGYQMNQTMLLSEQAEMDSKPQLEIYADDVKCSHGATVGALDADQLFYLRARGIPEETARNLLIEAFLDEAVEDAPEALRAPLRAALAEERAA